MPQPTRKRTLAAATGAGWVQPYGSNPFVFYADGGDGGSGTGDAGGDGEPAGDPNPDPAKPGDAKPDDKPQGDPAGEPKDGDDEPLGEAGKKALESERTARKEADKKAADLEQEVSRLRRANAANKGTDVDAIKAEIRSEFSVALLESQIEAAATGRLAKAEDAVLFADRDKIAELAKAGTPDREAIKALVDKVLEDRPYLAGESQQWGDVGSGHREAAPADVEPGLGRLRHAYATSSKTSK